MVLPKDVGMHLVFLHQALNPRALLFTFFDERTDVLPHFLCHNATPHNVLLVDLHDHPHLLEVVSVGVDFFHNAVDQGP